MTTKVAILGMDFTNLELRVLAHLASQKGDVIIVDFESYGPRPIDELVVKEVHPDMPTDTKQRKRKGERKQKRWRLK